MSDKGIGNGRFRATPIEKFRAHGRSRNEELSIRKNFSPLNLSPGSATSGKSAHTLILCVVPPPYWLIRILVYIDNKATR